MSQPVPDPVALLERYEQELASLKAVLVESETTASYLMLLNEPITGETLRLAGSAVDEGKDLWSLIDQIDQRLAQVREQVGTDPRPKQARQIPALLAEPLSSGGSVAQAITQVEERHAALSHWSDRVHGIWLSALAAVDGLRLELGRLEDIARRLALNEPRLARGRQRVAELEATLVSDPLSISDADIAELESLVGDAASALARIEADRGSLADDLGAAARQPEHLRVLWEQARAARREAAAKIGGAFTPTALPSVKIIEQLENQFAELQHHGDWQQQRFLLERWQTNVGRLEGQLQRICDHHRAPLLRRDELRGRLEAFRVKASATDRAEDLQLSALLREARLQLYTAPCDLEQAEQHLTQIAERLMS